VDTTGLVRCNASVSAPPDGGALIVGGYDGRLLKEAALISGPDHRQGNAAAGIPGVTLVQSRALVPL
jgi:hypothetical protein